MFALGHVWTPESGPSFSKLGPFCNTCVAVDYFSPRLLCRFDLAVRAISIRRRIASEREGLSFCWPGLTLLLVPLFAPPDRRRSRR